LKQIEALCSESLAVNLKRLKKLLAYSSTNMKNVTE
jgi:hypothetical protein